MTLNRFDGEKIRGYFFLSTGAALFFLNRGIFVFLSKAVLLIAALILVAYGALGEYLFRFIGSYETEKNLAGKNLLKNFSENRLRSVIALSAGGLLFLYSLGAFFELLEMIILFIALLAIVYGIVKSQLISSLKNKIEEQENKDK